MGLLTKYNFMQSFPYYFVLSLLVLYFAGFVVLDLSLLEISCAILFYSSVPVLAIAFDYERYLDLKLKEKEKRHKAIQGLKK